MIESRGDKGITKVTEKSIRRLQLSCQFREHAARINSLCFNNEGSLLVTSGDDDLLVLYDALRGRKLRSMAIDKTGINCAVFSHYDNAIIHAVRRGEHSVRLFSLHDNKYIRYFLGHEARVTHVEQAPIDDQFLTCSEDKSVRFWDTRAAESPAIIPNLTSRPCAAFDPEGLVTSVTDDTQCIRLYDKRNLESGPFSTFELTQMKDSEWTGLKFSCDGKSLLIMTSSNHLRLVDAFDGSLTHTFSGHENINNLPLKACFTPCSKYVICGSSDGRILIWSRESGTLVHTLKADHQGSIESVNFNYRYQMLATSCKHTKIWTPDMV